jgi:predicted DNA repair protein MutK
VILLPLALLLSAVLPGRCAAADAGGLFLSFEGAESCWKSCMAATMPKAPPPSPMPPSNRPA